MQKARYSGHTNKGLSGNVWADCPIAEIQQDPSAGFFLFDDFRNFGKTAAIASNIGRYAALGGGMCSWEDTGGTISQLATEDSGVVRITTDTTDNDAMSLSTGGGTGGLLRARTPANSGYKFWLEARVRVSQITHGNWLFGLAEESCVDSTTDLFSDAGALADKDFVGFRVLEGDPDGLDCGYNTASGGGETVFADVAQALAVDTWYKLGMRYDPNTGLYWYIDNVIQQDSSDNKYKAASATNFPDDEELCVVLGIKNSTTTAVVMDVDWIGVAAERVN